MQCTKKRIRSLKRNFPHIQLNKSYYVAVMLNEKIEAYAIKAGFRKELNLGDIVLPDGKCGPVSDFNANGKEVINKSRGKEQKNYDAIWIHEEFRGRDKREIVTSIVTRTVTRWCRDRVPPPEVQLTVIENSNKERFIVCPLSPYNTQNETLFLHMVNLLLEIFKECTILDETISNIIIPTKYNYWNWDILTQGEYPFSQLKSSDVRLTSMDKYCVDYKERVYSGLPLPSITHIGRAGFNGYIAMEYKSHNLLIFENMHYGNATYIFAGSFEENRFRYLTKKDILDQNLHINRIIHDSSWQQDIESYFK